MVAPSSTPISACSARWSSAIVIICSPGKGAERLAARRVWPLILVDRGDGGTFMDRRRPLRLADRDRDVGAVRIEVLRAHAHPDVLAALGAADDLHAPAVGRHEREVAAAHLDDDPRVGVAEDGTDDDGAAVGGGAA